MVIDYNYLYKPLYLTGVNTNEWVSNIKNQAERLGKLVYHKFKLGHLNCRNIMNYTNFHILN